MPKEKVIIIEQKKYDTEEIRQKIKGVLRKEIDVNGKSILLKPSFVYPSADAVQAITNPRFILGVVRALNELGACRVMVGESHVLGCARYHFARVGANILKKEAEMRYFDEEKKVKVRVDRPLVNETFTVPKIWKDADMFITLPKLKTNLFSTVTLSIKNNFGFLRKKDRYKHHDNKLHKYLADLYKVRPPDYAITDAIIAGEGQGPIESEPVNLGLMVCGKNAIAMDTVCATLLGIEPKSIEHLRLLHEQGFGPIELRDIEVEGDLEGSKRKFKMPEYKMDFPKVRAFIGNEKCCESGCLGMVQQVLDAYARHGKTPEMNVIMGKGVKISEEQLKILKKRKTLVHGDCVAEYKKYGKFVKGCPPTADWTVFNIWRVTGAGSPYIKTALDAPLLARTYLRHLFGKVGI